MTPQSIDKYKVSSVLGQGPAGETFEGKDPDSGRRIAIKLLSSESADQQLFLQDARAIADLSHPNVATVVDYGFEGRRPYLATELVSGTSLEAWLRKGRSLPDQLKVIEGLCDGLNHAHARGVLHRALKPSNVQVQSDGQSKLVDFGVSWAALGRGGRPAPSPYAAPEVKGDGAESPRSDIYSAGVIAYEVLAGRMPSGSPVTPLAEVRGEISRDVADAVMACLDEDPDWRPKDLTYLLEVVQRARGGDAPTTPRPTPRTADLPRIPGPAAGKSAKAASKAAGKAAAKTARRSAPGRPGTSHLPLYGAVAVALALASVGGWFWLHPPGAESPAPGEAGGPARPAGAPTAAPEPTPSSAATPALTASSSRAGAEQPSNHPTPSASAAPEEQPTLRASSLPAVVEVPSATTASTEPPAVDPVPTPVPAATPAVEPAVPATLTAVSPPWLRRGAQGLLDLRGTSFRAEHQVSFLKVKEAPTGLTVVRQRLVSPTLIQVLVKVDERAAPGAYGMTLSDGQGQFTNTLAFSVQK
jgi:serine/threonine-protein kinase